MKAREILAKLKRDDRNNIGAATLIREIPVLLRLLSCWSQVAEHIPVDANPDEEVPEDTPPTHHVRWLWARIEPDPAETWVMVSGLPDARHIREAIQVAMDNGLVFPDGTMSEYSKRYLRRQAGRVVGEQVVNELLGPADAEEA